VDEPSDLVIENANTRGPHHVFFPPKFARCIFSIFMRRRTTAHAFLEPPRSLSSIISHEIYTYALPLRIILRSFFGCKYPADSFYIAATHTSGKHAGERRECAAHPTKPRRRSLGHFSGGDKSFFTKLL